MQDWRPPAGATGDATVRRLHPLVRQFSLVERTVFGVLARAHATSSLLGRTSASTMEQAEQNQADAQDEEEQE